MLMCGLLEEAGWYYSVETPTAETYQQSGTYALSARADLTVHGSRRSGDRILNVEFKAGHPPVEVFRKDLEKLTREGIPGLWFHTLEKATPRTLRPSRGISATPGRLLLEHGSIATHDIHFAICVLDPAILFSTRLTLGEDLESRLEPACEGLTGWALHGPMPPPGRRRRAAAADLSGTRDRTGFEKWLISCPTIGPTPCCTSTGKATATGCASSPRRGRHERLPNLPRLPPETGAIVDNPTSSSGLRARARPRRLRRQDACDQHRILGAAIAERNAEFSSAKPE